jgi:calcineurin-like phosphoesterase family protein
MWWFTADQHFDHFEIIDFTGRPFSTPHEMNKAMIEAWNDHVDGGDVVVVAGDFTMHTKPEYVYDNFIRHLKGNKIFIRGNHDWWDRERRHLYHKQVYGQGIAVSHYPMRTWKNHQHGWWNLHGHSHGTLAPLRNQLDVGVDVAYQILGEYRPFSFDEIAYIMEERRDHSDDNNQEPRQ